MKLNSKIRYGLRTMIELAMNMKGKGVFQKEIAERQEISFKYLDQIIAALKASGLIYSPLQMAADLIENYEGRMSGYRLSRNPERISVYDVYKAFESEMVIIDCLKDEGICSREHRCATKEFWKGLNKLIVDYLESTDLEQLARKQKQLNKADTSNMYYI